MTQPIIFCPEMVNAILRGRKTQTRRIIPLATDVQWRFCEKDPDGNFWFEHGDDNQGGSCLMKPRYRIGDELWCREVWAPHRNYDATPAKELGLGLIIYAADGKESRPVIRWRSPYFMLKKHARLWLRVTAIKDPHRLQNINEEDAIAEGVEYVFSEHDCETFVGIIGTKPEDHGYKNYLWHGLIGKEITQKQSDSWTHQYSSYKSPIGSFSSLWNRLHRKPGKTWEDHPYVFPYVFQKIER